MYVICSNEQEGVLCNLAEYVSNIKHTSKLTGPRIWAGLDLGLHYMYKSEKRYYVGLATWLKCQLGLDQVVERNDCYPPIQVKFPQMTCCALNQYIIVMTSSLIVDWSCALRILGFTLGIIIEMRGSTCGFSPGFVTWKKKELLNLNVVEKHN